MENSIMVIKDEEIYRRLYTESGYASQSRESMGLPTQLCNRITITEDDKRLFEDFVTTSVTTVVSNIRRYFSACHVEHIKRGEGEDYFQFSFPLPANHQMKGTNLLNRAATDYIVASTMQQWAMTLKPDEANIYASKAQNSLAQMRDILTARKKPVKSID